MMSLLNRYLPMLGLLVVGFAAVEYAKSSVHVAPPAISVETQTPVPDTLSAMRIFTGDKFGPSYRITGVVAAYPFASVASWDINYAFQFDRTIRPSRNFELTALSRSAEARGIVTGDTPPASVSDCIHPHEDGLSSTGTEIAQTVVCNIASSHPDAPTATIGVIVPREPEGVTGEGGTICAEDVAHWHSLAAFTESELLICVIVDNDPQDGRLRTRNWMDIIVYQVQGDEIVNLVQEPRNYPLN